MLLIRLLLSSIQATQPSIPPGSVNEYQLWQSAGKAKAGMVHSISGWTRGVQAKLWDHLRTRAIPERLRGALMTRRYTNPHLPLPLPSITHFSLNCWCECLLVWLTGVLACRVGLCVRLWHELHPSSRCEWATCRCCQCKAGRHQLVSCEGDWERVLFWQCETL